MSYCVNKYGNIMGLILHDNNYYGEYINYILKMENITDLIIGNLFNRSIDELANCFPNLQTLIFGHKFNYPINGLANSFPNLQTLIFGNRFNYPINEFVNSFPKLKKLEFYETDVFAHYCHTYCTLLVLSNFVNLEYLTLPNAFSLSNGISLNELLISLPNLKNLHFNANFDQPLDGLEKSFPKMQSLHLGKDFDKPISRLVNAFSQFTKFGFEYKL